MKTLRTIVGMTGRDRGRNDKISQMVGSSAKKDRSNRDEMAWTFRKNGQGRVAKRRWIWKPGDTISRGTSGRWRDDVGETPCK